MGQKNLPLAGGERHAKAFERLGWTQVRKTKGKNPHIIMEKPGHRSTLSIPVHKGRDVKRDLLAGLLKDVGVSEDEYLRAFKKKTQVSPGPTRRTRPTARAT